jgi:hypothetical protein
MATPDPMMELIKSQRDQATPQGAPPSPTPGTDMSDASTPPSAAPMSTPEPKMGNREGAMVNVGMAMDLLEQSLPAFGSESEEGRKILAAIRTMTDILGPRKAKTGELQQSEILQLLQTLPQAGGATPEGKAMSQAPAIPGMAQNIPPATPPTLPGAGGGMPGAMPGGQPPSLT